MSTFTLLSLPPSLLLLLLSLAKKSDGG